MYLTNFTLPELPCLTLTDLPYILPILTLLTIMSYLCFRTSRIDEGATFVPQAFADLFTSHIGRVVSFTNPHKFDSDNFWKCIRKKFVNAGQSHGKIVELSISSDDEVSFNFKFFKIVVESNYKIFLF